MDLNKLFLLELADALHAERQLVKALPKLIETAQSEPLQQALSSHLEETKEHVTYVEQVLALFEKPARAKRCTGMEGIIADGSELVASAEASKRSEHADSEAKAKKSPEQSKEESTEAAPNEGEKEKIAAPTAGEAASDAAIVAAAQKAEHYEIAAYGTLIAWSSTLGKPEATDLLKRILAQEKAADQRLSQLAETFFNPQAKLPESSEQSRPNHEENKLTERNAMRNERELSPRSRYSENEGDYRGRREQYQASPYPYRERDDQGRFSRESEAGGYDDPGRYEYRSQRGRSEAAEERGRDDQGRFTGGDYRYDYSQPDDQRRHESRYENRSQWARPEGAENRERDDRGRFASDDGRRSGPRHEDDRRRYESRGDDWGYRSRSEGPEDRERDDRGRFVSDDERRGYARHDDDRRHYESRYEDRGHRSRSEAAEHRERDDHGRFAGGPSHNR